MRRKLVSAVCANSGLFGRYALNFKYHLIDVNRLKSEDLLKLDNVLATVFFIDQNRKDTPLSQFGRINQVLPQVAGWPEADERIFLKWLKDVALPRLSNSELLKRVRAELDSLNEKTEVKMFVSNFAVNFEKAMRTLDREEAELAQLKAGWAQKEQETKDEIAAAKARWAREERELVAAKERAERELAAAQEEIERLKRGN